MSASYEESKAFADQMREMKRADVRQFILIELGLLSLGLIFILASYLIKEGMVFDRHLWHFLMLEIGIGFITGFVIAGTVERFMRNREERKHQQHKQEIAENVFRALFGTAIPNELVKEMYAALFVPKFVREEIEITYKFEPLGKQPALPQDARKLRVNQEIRYLARNVIDKPVNHSSTPREDILVCDPENKATPFKEFLMEIVGSNPPQKIHLRELGELSAETQNQGMRYTLKTQTLKDVKPGQVVRAVLAIAKICRYADTDTWVTSYPAKQLRIKVDVAGSPPPDLEFWVDQAHRQKMVPVPESERPKALSYEWRLNFPILPYQGVMLRWRPRQSQSAMNSLPVEGSGATEL